MKRSTVMGFHQSLWLIRAEMWTMGVLCGCAWNVLLTTAIFFFVMENLSESNDYIQWPKSYEQHLHVRWAGTGYRISYSNLSIQMWLHRVRHWWQTIASSLDLQQNGHRNEHVYCTCKWRANNEPKYSWRFGESNAYYAYSHFRFVLRRRCQSKHNRQMNAPH